MNEGPTLRTIPARSFNSCSGCDFYQHFMIHSGRDPLYGNHCKHPERPDQEWEEKFGRGQGNLGTGNDTKTPDWCPIINQKK